MLLFDRFEATEDRYTNEKNSRENENRALSKLAFFSFFPSAKEKKDVETRAPFGHWEGREKDGEIEAAEKLVVEKEKQRGWEKEQK